MRTYLYTSGRERMEHRLCCTAELTIHHHAALFHMQNRSWPPGGPFSATKRNAECFAVFKLHLTKPTCLEYKTSHGI